MLRILEGTHLTGLQPQAAVALMECARIMEAAGYDCYVTSANDKRHSKTSLHYAGAAFDLRTHHIPSEEEKIIILDRFRKALGANYDALLEQRGDPNEHFHVEWQPRRP